MGVIKLSANNPNSQRVALGSAKKIQLNSKGKYKLCLSDTLKNDDLETTIVCKLIHDGLKTIEIHPIEMFFMPKDLFIPKSFRLFWHNTDCEVIYELS